MEVHDHRNVVRRRVQGPGRTLGMGSSALPGQNCGGRAVRGETHSTRFVTRLYLSGGDDGILAEDIGKDSGHNVHPQGWISSVGVVDA